MSVGGTIPSALNLVRSVRFQIGGSLVAKWRQAAARRSTSQAGSPAARAVSAIRSSVSSASGGSVLSGLLAGMADLFPEKVVPLLFELERQLGAALAHDPAADHHRDVVR